MKKAVYCAFATLSLFIFIPVFLISAFAVHCVLIQPAKSVTVGFAEHSRTIIVFFPTVSGRYYFTSLSDADTVGKLYDESMNELAFDDDSGDTSNFRIEYDFIKGKTYYFEAGYYDPKITIDMDIYLGFIEADASHEHIFKSVVSKNATCTQSGEITYFCECGYTYSEELPIVSHSFEITITEPTCTKSGSAVSVCKACGYKQTAVLEKLGHNYSKSYTTDKAPTCTARGNKSRHCMRCGSKTDITYIDALGHNYSEKWTVDKTSTPDAAGSKSHHCTRCAAKTDVTTIYKITKVTLSSDTVTYNGKKRTPAVTVKNSNGKKLKSGTDYTVSYQSGRKNVGAYKITVRFEGSYSGKVTKSFKILPKSVSSVSAKSTSSSITISWEKTDSASKYRIYKYNEKTKKYSVVANTSKTAYKIKNLKSGTKYHFFVRAIKVVNDKTYKSANMADIVYATKPSAVKLKAKAQIKSAKLSWKKSNGSGYIIYMYNKSTGKYEQVKKITDSSVVKYTKSNLARGVTYYFKIRAYVTADNKTLYSPMSDRVEVKAK